MERLERRSFDDARQLMRGVPPRTRASKNCVKRPRGVIGGQTFPGERFSICF
jgi:hypothetical protein